MGGVHVTAPRSSEQHLTSRHAPALLLCYCLCYCLCNCRFAVLPTGIDDGEMDEEQAAAESAAEDAGTQGTEGVGAQGTQGVGAQGTQGVGARRVWGRRTHLYCDCGCGGKEDSECEGLVAKGDGLGEYESNRVSILPHTLVQASPLRQAAVAAAVADKPDLDQAVAAAAHLLMPPHRRVEAVAVVAAAAVARSLPPHH